MLKHSDNGSEEYLQCSPLSLSTNSSHIHIITIVRQQFLLRRRPGSQVKFDYVVPCELGKLTRRHEKQANLLTFCQNDVFYSYPRKTCRQGNFLAFYANRAPEKPDGWIPRPSTLWDKLTTNVTGS